MNKILTLFAFLMIAGFTQAQTVITVRDSISTNTHWTCDHQYLLMGYVYVSQNATLTIDPGTVIKGDKNSKGSLIVERGSKLIANGTATDPIIFTSNQPAGSRDYGDWGGVILCGKSPVNWNAGFAQVEGGPRSLYGGTNPHDNSGSMQYVRIEFPGVAFSPNNEINGLTFCGVGDSTVIDHIQVSFSGDDSYEWFGGTVNCKHLIAHRGWDDDFDTDNGYSGNCQFLFGIRDPFAADQSGSKAFESDSYQNGTYSGLTYDASKITRPVFSNCTIIGPLIQPASTSYDPQFVSAAHIRRGSSLSLMNSVLVGYPAGILFDESASTFGSTSANYTDTSRAQIRNTVVCGIPGVAQGNSTPKDVFYVINGARSLTPTTTWGDTTANTPFNPWSGPINFFNDPSFHNKTYPNEQTGVRLGNPFNLTNPNGVPTSTSPFCYNSKALPAYITGDPFHNGRVYPFNPALPINRDTSGLFAHYNAPTFWPDFHSNKLTNPFFDKVNYVGAFSGTQTTADDWTTGWSNFDPQNTPYNTVCTPNGVATIDANGNATLFAVSPNPASSVIEIKSDLTVGTVTISSVDGKVVLTENFKQVNVSTLNSGVYFVQVKDINGVDMGVSKLVITK